MHRIPPSQKIRKKMEELLKQGLDGEVNVTSLVVGRGIERVVQEMVEQAVTDYLERCHRAPAGARASWLSQWLRAGTDSNR